MPKEIPLNYCLMVKSTAAEREGCHFSFNALQPHSCSSGTSELFEHLSNGQIVPKPEPESLLPWSLGRPGSPRINSPMHAQFSPQKSSQCYSSSLLSSLNSSPVRRKGSSILWLPMKLWSSASELKKKKKQKKEGEALIYFQSLRPLIITCVLGFVRCTENRQSSS